MKYYSPNMDNKQIETIELKYLNELNWHFTNERDKIIKLLESKDIMKDQWEHIFNKKTKNSETGEMSRGAERVFGTFFPNTWLPNSTPIGSDFMFETIDSIIHIDIKTAKLDNDADHRGKVALSLNQTSYHYSTQNEEIKGSLPLFYNLSNNVKEKKLTITYMIQTVYDEKDYTICCILLICVPNGQLYSVYGDDIMDAGKNKGNSFRYRYGDQTFKLLNDNIPRYTIPFCKSKYIEERITSLKR